MIFRNEKNISMGGSGYFGEYKNFFVQAINNLDFFLGKWNIFGLLEEKGRF